MKIRFFRSFFKLTCAGVMLAFFLVANPANSYGQAQNDVHSNFGIGVIIGEPTGVSVKKWLSHRLAFDVSAAWSLANKDEALHMHADLLYHSWFSDTKNLAFYYGLGARVIFAGNAEAGLRVPIGLNYVFNSIPFDIFVEAAPILDFSPDVQLAGNGGVGIRYYF